MTSMNSESTSECRMSLEFELKLLEVAVLGAHAFGTYWNIGGLDFTIRQHVLCYKIYEEIVGGHINLLISRGRNLVVRSKRVGKSHHERAVKLHNELFQIQHFQSAARNEKLNKMRNIESPESWGMGQRTLSKDSGNTSSQHLLHKTTASSFLEECDKELKWTPGEKCNMTPLEISSLRDLIKADEPSSERDELKNSSSESNVVSSIERVGHDIKDMALGDEASNKYNLPLDIPNWKSSESFQQAFDKAWPQTPQSSSESIKFYPSYDEVHSPTRSWSESEVGPCLPLKKPSKEKLQLDKIFCASPEECWTSNSSSESVIQFKIQEETNDRELRLDCYDEVNNAMKDQTMKESKEFQIGRLASFNSVMIGASKTIVLDKFPGEDFKVSVTWNVGRTCYLAKTITDLRSRYKTLIEGAFKMSKRGYMWSDYYGFLLRCGQMLCFRKKTYRKVVEFSKWTIITADERQLKLKINRISDESKKTACVMKFSSRERYKIWYGRIVQFTR